MLPEDLKRYHEDTFSLMEPGTAAALLFVALAILLVLERMGIL